MRAPAAAALVLAAAAAALPMPDARPAMVDGCSSLRS